LVGVLTAGDAEQALVLTASATASLAAHAYAQYNCLERRFVANLRLRYIYRPGSDLYVVFNEERGEPGDPRALLSRGFAVKGTWLIRF
jgi:hypothetical protein